MAALLATATAATVLAATPALAQVVTDPVTHQRYGIVPPPNPLLSAPPPGTCNADPSGGVVGNPPDCTKLAYNGGPVMGIERVHLFFWEPSGHTIPTAYSTALARWLNDEISLDYTPKDPFSVDQQYYVLSGSTKSFIHYALSNSGSIFDTNAYPKSGCTDTDATGTKFPICLTDAQMQSQLSSWISSHKLPTGLSNEYFILTPSSVGSCMNSSSTSCYETQYCGYHYHIGTSGTQTLYAVLPWAYKTKYCDVNLAFGAGYPYGSDVDSVVSVFEHELSETMTDPDLNAWYQNGGADPGSEIGDKCAYIYNGSGYEGLTGLSNNGAGYWNIHFGSDDFLTQLMWSNRNDTCEFKDTDTQPVVTISVSPNPPVHGKSAKFTANVTDPAGVNAVQWYFGDGSAGVNGNPVNHTYASAGTYKVSVFVTDGHGNQTRFQENITVK